MPLSVLLIGFNKPIPVRNDDLTGLSDCDRSWKRKYENVKTKSGRLDEPSANFIVYFDCGRNLIRSNTLWKTYSADTCEK